nr:DUF5702 domain-containing protein [Lachnospiraceae bacterium]
LTGSTEKAPTVEKTLTKHELSEDLNYVYQAELEYILGGHNSSKDNLNDTRNRILAFEAVLNYTASYSVGEVNDAINAARDAAAAINPIAGIAVGAALRLGFTAAETAGDWKVLKSGNKVKIGKRATADCTGLQLIGSLIGVSSTDTYQPTDGLQLSYRDFVQIMILFLTSYGNVVGRTQTLVTVNMNYLEFASAGGDVPAEPNFKLEEAHTAVEASCSVKSPWWMMPLGFAARTTPEHAGELASFADNTYTYSVIRSY